MKKLFAFLCAMFAGAASATTVNIDWLMDGATYAQTTCETGGNFTLPTPTPTKYGYHFVGWKQNDAVGSWSQSGTPTPDNPIEPTFRQFGNTVFRALGSGDNFVADSYNPTTGKITRRVGVQVLDGTENWQASDPGYFLASVFSGLSSIAGSLCTHFTVSDSNSHPYDMNIDYGGVQPYNLFVRYDAMTTLSNFKQFLADQYAAGTPVTIYYPLATPVEENYNAQ